MSREPRLADIFERDLERVDLPARERWRPAPTPRRARRLFWGFGTAALAVVLVGTLTATGVADTILTIFEPKTFVATPITRAELSALPDLSDYGTMTWTAKPQVQEVATAAAASVESGLRVVAPATLPAGVSGSVRYYVAGKASATFTFSAAKAAAAAARSGKALPQMPPDIDGATLTGTAGPAVGQMYAGTAKAGESMSMLVIGQAIAPTVTSTGVTAAQLRDYLLRQPGIPPELAAKIRAIGDPMSTMLVPIPVDAASSHPVTVQGVQGLFVGDNTGLGAGVIWQKDGVVYVVGGTLSESQLLQVAGSLR